jgi:LysR family glycine cleavage system transcriptional activator
MMFDQHEAVIRAAAAGLGLGLFPVFLIEDELSRGELVQAIDTSWAGNGSYYLVWPAVREMYPPLVAFRDWLLAEVASAKIIGPD